MENRSSSATSVLAALVSVVALTMTACTSGPSSSGAGSSQAPTDQAVSPSPTIAIGQLQGKILFTRAGYKYGDETVFTADADGQRTAHHGVR